MSKIILDLCGGSGAWGTPYRNAGYDVRIVTLPKDDVRTYAPLLVVKFTGFLQRPLVLNTQLLGMTMGFGKRNRNEIWNRLMKLFNHA